MHPATKQAIEEAFKANVGAELETVVVSSPGAAHLVVELFGKNFAPISAKGMARAQQVAAVIVPVGMRCDVRTSTVGVVFKPTGTYDYPQHPTAPKYAGRECPCGMLAGCSYHHEQGRG